MTLRTWLFGPPVRHDWQLIDKTVLPSGLEQLIASGGVESIEASGIGISRKAVVLTFKCSLTGNIKVIKETNS